MVLCHPCGHVQTLALLWCPFLYPFCLEFLPSFRDADHVTGKYVHDHASLSPALESGVLEDLAFSEEKTDSGLYKERQTVAEMELQSSGRMGKEFFSGEERESVSE